MDLTTLAILAAPFVAAVYDVVSSRRPLRAPSVPAPEALTVSAYLAADVTAGLPNEEMVRAAIVEYMADESSDVQACISRLESDLDFYVPGKGEGVARPPIKPYGGMIGPLDPRPVRPDPMTHDHELCDCDSPICALRRRFGARPLDTGQRETR